MHFAKDPNDGSIEESVVKGGGGGLSSKILSPVINFLDSQSNQGFNINQIEIPQDILRSRAEAFLERVKGIQNSFLLPGEKLLHELPDLKKKFDHVIGTTTFSGQRVHESVKPQIKEILKERLLESLKNGEKILVVSGSTNLGGVKDTYDALNDPELVPYRKSGQLQAMGLVAGVGVVSAHKKQGKENAWGIRNTEYYYIHESGEGWRDDLNVSGPGGWGTESPAFQDFITELIAFGGGPQAADEIASVSQKGKPVTVLLGVKNGAGDDGEAELKVRIAKLGDIPQGKEYVEKVKAEKESKITACIESNDEKALKALNKLLDTINKALAFTLSDEAKRNINIIPIV